MRVSCFAVLINSLVASTYAAVQVAECGLLVSLPPPTIIVNGAQSSPRVTAAPPAPKFELLKRDTDSLIGYESVSNGTCMKSYEDISSCLQYTKKANDVVDRTFNCPSNSELLFSTTFGGCCVGPDDCSIATRCALSTLFYGQGGSGVCASGCGTATWRQSLGAASSSRIIGCNPAGRNIPNALYQNNPGSTSSSSSSSSSSSTSSSSSLNSSSSSSSSAAGTSKKSSHTGAIVGGVVGGVVGLFLIILLVVGLLCMRHRKRRHTAEADKFAASSMPPSAYTAPAVPASKGSYYDNTPTQSSTPVAYSSTASQQHYQPPPQISGAVLPSSQAGEFSSLGFHDSPNYGYTPAMQQQQQHHDVASPLHSNAVSTSPISSISGQGYRDSQFGGSQRYSYQAPMQMQSPLENYEPHALEQEAQAPRYPGARTYAPDRTSGQRISGQRISGQGW